MESVATAVRDPFAALRELERLGAAASTELPAQEKAQETWSGVAFRIGGQHFVTALDDVVEILNIPDLSRVPHSRAWVRGMANVRGTLLPVMDLSGYLGVGTINPTRLSRVMVIDRAGVSAGLLVDEVLGMRHFLVDERRDGSGDVDDSLRRYVHAHFAGDGGLWPVFDMEALARDPGFLKVAE